MPKSAVPAAGHSTPRLSPAPTNCTAARSATFARRTGWQTTSSPISTGSQDPIRPSRILPFLSAVPSSSRSCITAETKRSSSRAMKPIARRTAPPPHSSVPTPLEAQGNFSQTFNKNGQLQIIYNPLSTNLTTGARTPFQDNIIPQSHAESGRPGAGVLLSHSRPADALLLAAPNYSFTGSYPNRGDQRLFKVDHLFTNWFRASASYIHQKTFEVDYPENIFPNRRNAGPGLFAATGKSTPPRPMPQ